VSQPQSAYQLRANDLVRFLLELFAIFSLAYWGYLAWPFPWPGLLFMIVAPLFAIVVWALFRSPKARIPLDPVGKALVEIFVMGAAVATWFMLGDPIVGALFGIVALISGIVNAKTENATTENARAENAGNQAEDTE
jgi:hypothetical protein